MVPRLHPTDVHPSFPAPPRVVVAQLGTRERASVRGDDDDGDGD